MADRLQAHYTTTNAAPHQKSTTFTPFFKEVWDKKPEIEQAFNMEDPSGMYGTQSLYVLKQSSRISCPIPLQEHFL